jgi:hypothetical protein
LSDDELAEAAPPKKKSRKEPAARSIVNIAPERIPVIEKAYGYMYMKTLTNESRTWVHGRAELAEFSQAFNWALNQLGLHPDDFEPVTYLEQDLVCSFFVSYLGSLFFSAVSEFMDRGRTSRRLPASSPPVPTASDSSLVQPRQQRRSRNALPPPIVPWSRH